MASIKDEYALSWHKYAGNLTINFKNLLQQQKLVDVTLVADGHLFSAHRLILSALSPYFQRMFDQMPVTQQAFGKFLNVLDSLKTINCELKFFPLNFA